MKKKQHDGDILKYLRKTMRIMRLSLFLIVISTAMAFSATSYSQNTKLTLDVNSATVKEVLKAIEKQSEFLFFYQEKHVDLNRQVTLHVTNQDVETILNQLFAGTNNIYVVNDRQIVIGVAPRKELERQIQSLIGNVKTVVEQPQQKEITGKVTDTGGLPLPGVSVIVKGTNIGMVTNSNGEFNFSVPLNAEILQFFFVGLQTQEVPIQGRTLFTVVMVEDNLGIEEVVAIGYGSQKKATMTGAVGKLEGESLLTSPVTNITNSLQGKVAGVTSIQQNGQPGLQNADIFIRGRATLGDATAIVIVDGVERSDFGSMDPNTIETITILKDASSTAIFGIRGANGVVVVTTKTGKEARPVFSYTGNLTGNFYMDMPERLNAYETAKLQNIGAHNNGKSKGWNHYWTDEELEHFKNQDLPYQYADVDWMKTVTRKFNMTTQHNLSVQGGTKRVKYYVQSGYLGTNGILKEFPSTLGIKSTDSYNKYNFRSNLDIDVTNNLRVSMKAAGTMEEIYQPRAGGNLGGYFYSVLNIPSNRSPVYLEDGRYAGDRYAPGHQAGHPVAMITENGYTKGQKNRLEANLDIDLKLNWLTEGLNFKTLVAYDNIMDSYIRQNANYSLYYIDRTTKEILRHPSFLDDTALSNIIDNSIWGPNGGLSYNLQTGFDYANEFGKNNVTGLVRFTRRQTEINNAADAPFAYQGLVSRLTYNYDNKYLIEGSVAYNGSENFPKGKRYGVFPSGSVGYIISNEPSFKTNVSFINFLKIRASLGLVGNDKFAGGTARFLYLDEYSVTTSNLNWTKTSASLPGFPVYFGQPSSPVQYEVMTHNRIGNPNITWETGLKSDIGLEVNFFKDKIKLVADYFHERRSDILIDSRAGLFTYGEGYPKLNKGIVENQGYEIEVDMHNNYGDFRVGLMASISHSSNMVIDADDPPGIPDYQKLAGKRVGQFFGFKTAGFYNTQQEIDDSNNFVEGAWPKNTMAVVVPGDLKFVDYNNDGIINSMDRHPILTSNLPEYNYSLNPTLAYKNFSLSVLFQGTMKSMSDFLMTFNYFGYMKDSWTPENYAAGKTITWPALRDDWFGPSIAPQYSNDFVIKSNDYLKLRNLEIAYQLPVAFVRRLSMSSARVYISGQNLATWSSFKDFYGVDPEVYIGGTGGSQTTKREYAYPLARNINLGVSIQF